MYICYICLSCLLPKINFVDYTTVHVPSSVWLVSLRAILPYSPVTCFFISLRCGWSVIMDPIFAVLSEQFTEAEFLQVDSEECRVQQFKCFVHLCHAFVQLFIIVTVQLLVTLLSLSLPLSLSLSLGCSRQIRSGCIPDICILQKSKTTAQGRISGLWYYCPS